MWYGQWKTSSSAAPCRAEAGARVRARASTRAVRDLRRRAGPRKGGARTPIAAESWREACLVSLHRSLKDVLHDPRSNRSHAFNAVSIDRLGAGAARSPFALLG